MYSSSTLLNQLFTFYNLASLMAREGKMLRKHLTKFPSRGLKFLAFIHGIPKPHNLMKFCPLQIDSYPRTFRNLKVFYIKLRSLFKLVLRLSNTADTSHLIFKCDSLNYNILNFYYIFQ